MSKKNRLFIFLFSIFMPLSYLNLINNQLSDFEEALELRSTSGVPIYLTAFQSWTFDIISLLWDSIMIAIAVGLITYYLKEIKVYLAVLVGFLSRYIVGVSIFLYGSIKGQISFAASIERIDSRLCILLSIQILLTLSFSYLGFYYGRRTDYLDDKDKELYYFCGVSKKLWYLLFISFTPVVRFLSQLTIVQIYEVTKKIISMDFWKDTFSLSNIFSEDSARGITGLVGHLMVIAFVWTIGVALFYFGFDAVKNKDAKLRWLRICSIFILLPSIIVFIPIIRNRTWFF